jgi:hypothetical protein
MKLPRFTLRELFLLVLACATVAGWWVDHSRQHLMNLRLTDEAKAAEEKAFLVGVEQVENWLKSLAHKGNEDAVRVLSDWEMESKSWRRTVELQEFGERTAPKSSLVKP